MKALWNELIENESGLILSAELVLIVTIAVLGLVTGLACVQQAVVSELQDISLAFCGLNQSYSTPSFRGCRKWWGPSSWTAGSGFIDFNRCSAGGGGFAVGSPGGSFMGGLSEIGGTSGCLNSTAPGCVASPTVAAPQSISIPCESCPSPTPGPTQPAAIPQQP